MRTFLQCASSPRKVTKHAYTVLLTLGVMWNHVKGHVGAPTTHKMLARCNPLLVGRAAVLVEGEWARGRLGQI